MRDERIHIIRKGEHYSDGRHLELFTSPALTFSFTLPEEAWYEARAESWYNPPESNPAPINKLVGFREGLRTMKDGGGWDSARVGWLPDWLFYRQSGRKYKRFILFFYGHVGGVNLGAQNPKPVFCCWPGQNISGQIEARPEMGMDSPFYLFRIMDQTRYYDRRDPSWRDFFHFIKFVEWPYFGGPDVAERDIRIWLSVRSGHAPAT